MERRNGFSVFICSLIPGIGYMYLGLIEKGIEALLIFLLIKPVFRAVGMGFIGGIVQFVFWIYTFTDTYNIVRKMDRGEYVPDTSIFGNTFKNGTFKEKASNINDNISYNERVSNIKKNKYNILGWLFIILGSLTVLNKVFEGNEIYYIIKSSINTYFIPIAFVVLGIYILIKK